MSALVKCFTIGWLSFPGLLVVIVLTSVAMGPASLWDRAAILLGLIGVMAGGVAVMKVGLMLGRSEERMLLAFIKSSLDASEKTLPPGNNEVQGSGVL